ncbi:MAG TPA: hypothetical protein VF903_00820 [Nitrospirota bacterium]
MKITLADLENIAKALQVKVSYDDIKTSRGGSCRVLESRRIIINKHLQNADKINLLACELANFDLSALHIPDGIRKKIAQEAEQRKGAEPVGGALGRS